MERFPAVLCLFLLLVITASAIPYPTQDAGQNPPAARNADKKNGTKTKKKEQKSSEKQAVEQKAVEQKAADQMAEAPKAQTTLPEHQSIEGTIVDISKDGASLRIKTLQQIPGNLEKQEKILVLKVQEQALKDGLKKWNAGDKVIAGVNIEKKEGVETLMLWNLEPQIVALSAWIPGLVMFVALVTLLLLTWILTRNLGGIRSLLFLGMDGKYSNSKTQMALWFSLVIVTYVSALSLRWYAGLTGLIGIPANLLALTGMSALTFAGAKGITTQKVANAVAAAAAVPVAAAAAKAAVGTPAQAQMAEAHIAAVKAEKEAPLGKTGLTAKFPQDLVQTDDGKYDFGDYQMIVITVISVLGYLAVAYHFLTNMEQRGSIQLPDVDGTLTALFGVGQGAYLTKKAVADIKH
jgi:hypothetical protein